MSAPSICPVRGFVNCPAGVGQEFAVIADQAARRGEKSDPDLAATGRPEVGHFRAPPAHLFDHDAGEVLIDVDLDFLDRLQALAGPEIVPVDHPRPADRELEALAPHGLDQDAELQLAAPGDFEGVLIVGLPHVDRDVALGFAQ